MENLLDTGHYLKTELEHVTVTDLDGELHTQFEERNLLREKTFNNELNALVNKIFNNEKIGEEPLVFQDEPAPAEKNSLLEKCEKLIYKLKHFEELNSSSSVYNPFDADINIYDDIDDTADYVKAGLIQCGYEHYQILKYNFKDKSYRSNINLLDDSFSADMFFSIKDPLIKRISRDPEGFVIDPGLINSDPFFKKKFLNPEKDNKSAGFYYIVKLNSLLVDPFLDDRLNTKEGSFDIFLSPLLLIEINGELNPGKIFRSLKKNTSIPLLLYFLKNRARLNANNDSYEDLLLMMDLFISSMVDSELTGYIITLKKYTQKDNIFILKFFLSKLRRMLKNDSLLLRVSLNKTILFTTSGESVAIGMILERINSSEEIISVEPVDFNSCLGGKGFAHFFL